MKSLSEPLRFPLQNPHRDQVRFGLCRCRRLCVRVVIVWQRGSDVRDAAGGV